MRTLLLFPLLSLLLVSPALAQPLSPLHDTLAVLTVKGVYERVLKQTKAPRNCGEALLRSRSLTGMLAQVGQIEDCNGSKKEPENGAKTRALLQALRTWQVPTTLISGEDTAAQLVAAVGNLPEVVTLFEKKSKEKAAFDQKLTEQLRAYLQQGDWAVLTAIPVATVAQTTQPQPVATSKVLAEEPLNWSLIAALAALALAGVLGYLYLQERKKNAAKQQQPESAQTPVSEAIVQPTPPVPGIPLHERLAKQAASADAPVVPVPLDDNKLPINQTIDSPLPDSPSVRAEAHSGLLTPDSALQTPDSSLLTLHSSLPPSVRFRYFSFPDGQGFSDPSGLDKFRPGVSVFELQITDNQARFGVADRPEAMPQALSDDLQYLNPVCTYQNPFSPDATRIATVQQGIAHLQGDVWVVSQKAIIQFS